MIILYQSTLIIFSKCMMATIKNPSEIEKVNLVLNSQEKTIRYAQTQIAEGELMSGKSILDVTLRQL